MKNKIIFIKNNLYIPVLWANKNINYGEEYGLLYFLKVYGGFYKNYKGLRWFGVRVFSPDDWDVDLDVILKDIRDEEADIRFNKLIEITKNYLSTGSVLPSELFEGIKKSFLDEYPDMETSSYY